MLLGRREWNVLAVCYARQARIVKLAQFTASRLHLGTVQTQVRQVSSPIKYIITIMYQYPFICRRMKATKFLVRLANG
jgi:hypothetical protein